VRSPPSKPVFTFTVRSPPRSSKYKFQSLARHKRGLNHHLQQLRRARYPFTTQAMCRKHFQSLSSFIT
jgi:hypothetical protein